MGHPPDQSPTVGSAFNWTRWNEGWQLWGLGGYLLTFHFRGIGSIPGQSTWDLQWTNWNWTGFSSNTLLFPCKYNSTDAPHSFIHVA